ncbi:MAG: M23 family metallopeptidase [Gammaproteobacteria bacterium]|nr:M23 family metallopeptidase [Gammaproteobacteria bacterium]
MLLIQPWLPGGDVIAGELELEGNWSQGGLVQGRTQPNARVEFDGKRIRVSSNGDFLLGFGRDDEPKHRLVVEFSDGTSESRVVEIKQRKYRIQRVNGLPKQKVTPKPKSLKRIRRESALARKARERDDERTDFVDGFKWPVVGPISGVYGSQRILNGKPRRPHFGVDVAVPTGTPVHAPADGVVSLTHPDMFFSGGTLILDHGHGLSSSFLHLSRILVKDGDHVQQGDVIAEVGATGRVTGAHLDWRMNLFRTRIDPQLLAGAMPASKPVRREE